MGSVRILLVDDTPVIVDRLSKAFGAIDGVEIVGVCQDSAQAIGDIVRLRPNVVVLDIHLRGSSGWDVLQSVIATHPETRVFMFTNDTGQATREKFECGGADRFFDKSLQFGALYREVRALANASW